jgi:thiamine pyrophosphate-dependent acetolactate synthase large subunit-like protein
MRRAEAVQLVMQSVRDELVVVCNGMIGREVFTYRDRTSNFYMIGSMGLALSIGIGVAVSHRDRSVLVIDGDGNVLMSAGALASAAAADLQNLRHIVLDNEAHGSTGGQRTITESVALEEIARASGYRYAARVSPADLAGALPDFLRQRGPAMLLVKVEKGNVPGIARVSHTPPDIARRFARSIQPDGAAPSIS